MKAFLQASHGFHIRNLVDTSLFELLIQDLEVVLLTDPADAEACRRDYATPKVSVESVEIRRRRIEPLLELVRKRIMIKPSRALTLSVFSDRERKENPAKYLLLRTLNSILGRSRYIRHAWLAFERSWVSGKEFDSLFERHRPDIVITANYGTDPETIRLLRAANRHSIPSVTVVPSFDNLTSKGAIAAAASRMIVWNETMRREASELHDIEPSAVAACGPIQFDIYADPSRWADRDTVWRAHGLDARRPTFVVGTITPVYFPYNIDVIELIAEAIESGRLPRDGQVLVRMHPQVIHDHVFGDDLRAYEALTEKYPFVRLNIPAVRNWGKLHPPAKDDMSVLAAILANAAAVVVPASTLAIDAAAVDTPVVGVGFDGKTVQPPESSVARYYSFTHYRPVTESGAVAVAYSPDELIDSLNTALSDRTVRSEGRRRLIASLIGRHDSGAARRIMSEVHALLAERNQPC